MSGGAPPRKGGGKGKSKMGGKGGDSRQQKPHYDSASPCGYYVAGYCRRGSSCAMQHSVPYALTIRSEWLQPEDGSAKDALRAAAERELGAAEARSLFPRVLSQALALPAPDSPEEEAAREPSSRPARRWSRARLPEGAHVGREEGDEDGFAWEEEEERPEACADSSPLGPPAVPAPPRGAQRLRHLLVLDLEGKDEIIEFPVIAIDVLARREVGRFQRFVRPHRLFDGCARTPDSPAVPFPLVLRELGQWLREDLGFGLEDMGGAGATAAFLTCGDWDCKHVHTQCGISDIPAPPAFRQWVNVKRSYSEAYGGDFRGMKSMLARLKLLDGEGNVTHGFHHLGMHDVENIGRCVLHLLWEGADISINGRMRSSGAWG